jgi:hypothetical protein
MQKENIFSQRIEKLKVLNFLKKVESFSFEEKKNSLHQYCSIIRLQKKLSDIKNNAFFVFLFFLKTMHRIKKASRH